MPGTSIKDQIKKLVDLQKIDTQIYQLNIELTDKPKLIDELKQQFEETKAHLAELDKKYKDLQVQRKNNEVDLQQKEDSIAKSKIQLSELKTNREYTAKITEIESMNADKSQIEEKIILLLDEGEAAAKAVDAEKAKVAGREKEYGQKKKIAEDDMAVLKDRIKVLESQRQRGLDGIEPSTLVLYDRILKHKSGKAIVAVQNGSCMGCFMSLNPQQINMLKMADQILQCETCQRILYLEEIL